MARAWCRRLHPDQWMVRAGLPRGSHSSRHSNRLTSGTVSGMSSPTNLSPFYRRHRRRRTGYRHSYWDSGTILANTLAIAAAHGLPAKVVAGFVDSSVNRLLDLENRQEVALVLVPVGFVPEPSIGSSSDLVLAGV